MDLASAVIISAVAPFAMFISVAVIKEIKNTILDWCETRNPSSDPLSQIRRRL